MTEHEPSKPAPGPSADELHALTEREEQAERGTHVRRVIGIALTLAAVFGSAVFWVPANARARVQRQHAEAKRLLADMHYSYDCCEDQQERRCLTTTAALVKLHREVTAGPSFVERAARQAHALLGLQTFDVGAPPDVDHFVRRCRSAAGLTSVTFIEANPRRAMTALTDSGGRLLNGDPAAKPPLLAALASEEFAQVHAGLAVIAGALHGARNALPGHQHPGSIPLIEELLPAAKAAAERSRTALLPAAKHILQGKIQGTADEVLARGAVFGLGTLGEPSPEELDLLVAAARLGPENYPQSTSRVAAEMLYRMAGRSVRVAERLERDSRDAPEAVALLGPLAAAPQHHDVACRRIAAAVLTFKRSHAARATGILNALPEPCAAAVPVLATALVATRSSGEQHMLIDALAACGADALPALKSARRERSADEDNVYGLELRIIDNAITKAEAHASTPRPPQLSGQL